MDARRVRDGVITHLSGGSSCTPALMAEGGESHESVRPDLDRSSITRATDRGPWCCRPGRARPGRTEPCAHALGHLIGLLFEESELRVTISRSLKFSVMPAVTNMSTLSIRQAPRGLRPFGAKAPQGGADRRLRRSRWDPLSWTALIRHFARARRARCRCPEALRSLAQRRFRRQERPFQGTSRRLRTLGSVDFGGSRRNFQPPRQRRSGRRSQNPLLGRRPFRGQQLPSRRPRLPLRSWSQLLGQGQHGLASLPMSSVRPRRAISELPCWSICGRRWGIRLKMQMCSQSSSWCSC